MSIFSILFITYNLKFILVWHLIWKIKDFNKLNYTGTGKYRSWKYITLADILFGILETMTKTVDTHKSHNALIAW